jgi:hypothetical protein
VRLTHDTIDNSPGRFFAGTELKTMLAYAVFSYDIKLKNGGAKPPNLWVGLMSIPDGKAEVLFRKRDVPDASTI